MEIRELEQESISQPDVNDNGEGKSDRPLIKKRFFIGCILLSMLLLMGIMLFNLQHTYQTARNNVIELSKNSSIQNAESIEMFFLRHEDVLLTTAEAISYGLEEENMSAEEVEKLLHNTSIAYNDKIYSKYADKEFTGIYAAVDGVLIHGMKTPDDLPEGYNPLNRQWYKEAVAGKGNIVFGEPYQDIYTPFLVMTATKLLDDKETVVAMDITLDDLQFAGGGMDVSIKINDDEHIYGYGFVLTNRGIVVAHRDKSEQGNCYDDRESPMYEVFQNIKESTQNGIDYFETEIDGAKYGIFPRKLSNGWYAVTLTDMEEISDSISAFSSIVIFGSFVVALLVLLYLIIILREYTRSGELTENLRKALALAKQDGLTGHSNRTAYDMRVREFQENMGTEKDESFTLIMMDLNDLKYVNDHFGHVEGDQYICNACDLVMGIIPSELYRIGGDEFAVFIAGEDLMNHEELFGRLKQAVSDANMALVTDVNKPSMAFGVATHIKGNLDDMDALLRKADVEMYINKSEIKQARLENSENGYTPDLKFRLMDKQLLASEMVTAIEEEQFEVWFQPQVNHARGGAIIGAEALVRWRHPTRGMVSPGVFIPMFEYNGLIYELDKYVWKHACAYLRKRLDEGDSPLPISVNVSRIDIMKKDFLETIISIVDEQNIPYDMIHIEVTESAFTENTGRVVQVVKELINRGFIIAIDDFGSGYSSLSMMRSVPAHILKLDMRFFSDREDQSRNECIIESVVRMAKMLGMAVLAEGVEYIEQADLLQTLGCEYIQGYVYSKPLPCDEYIAYESKRKSEATLLRGDRQEDKVEEESAPAQELFRNIISGTNDIIIVADLHTKQLLYANQTAERFYGKSFDPMNFTTCSEYCERGEFCDNCPANGLGKEERKEILISYDEIHMKALYSRMEWNGYDALVFYQTDISSEVREKEFAESLVKNIPAAVVTLELDENGYMQYGYVSEQAQKFFLQMGIKNKTLRLEDFFSIMYPEDAERIRSAAAVTFAEKIRFREEFCVQLDDGSTKWMEFFINPVEDKNGQYMYYGIFTDITDRKNAQARVDRMIQNLPIALTIFSAGSSGAQRIFLSDYAKRMLGLSDDNQSKVDMDIVYDHIHPDDEQRMRGVGRYCVENKLPASSQFRIKGEDGKYRWVQLETMPIMQDAGEYLYYGIYTDMNAQKKFEEGLHNYELNRNSSLMNNLGVGIVVFRGDNINELIPVFCNDEYLQLSGLTYEEFQTLLVKDALYGVHPDDIADVRRKFIEAFCTNRPMQHRLRVQKPRGKYEWVSMHANIKHIETGGFEVYMIFSDAEEEMQKFAMDVERYENFIERTREKAMDSLSLNQLNLTRDDCFCVHREIKADKPVVFENGIDALIASEAENIANSKVKAEFIKKFNAASLMASFERGVFVDEMKIPVRLSDHRIIWCYQSVSVSKNPTSGDIEAIMTLTEADKDIRMGGYYKRLISADYDIVANIDVETGFISVIQESEKSEIPAVAQGVAYYMDSVDSRVRLLVDEEFVDLCVEALSLNTILDALKTQNIYTCTFPANKSLLGYDGAFRWRFGYVNSSKEEILFSRKEIMGLLDRKQRISTSDNEAQIKSRQLGEAAKFGETGRNTILIADDVEINREILKIIFEDRFNILEAEDGEEAINLIDNHHDRLAIILLDLKMPKKSGIDVLIHMNMRGLKDRIPVMMVTGESTEEMSMRSLEYGISDIISKPFDSKIVKRRALNLIELYAHKEGVE